MKRTFGFLISLTAFGFVVWYLFSGLTKFEGVFFKFKPGFFILACFCAVFSYFIRYKGWNALCLIKGYKIPYTTTTIHLASSEIIRYIPGNVWGFGARIVKAKKLGISYQDGAWLLIHESFLLLCTASFLVITGILSLGIESPLYLVLSILFVVVCFSLLFLKPILELISIFIKKITKNDFLLSSSSPYSFLKVSPYYFLYWLLFGMGHVFLAFSLFDGTQNYLILISTWSLISWAIGYFSLITPSGLGVRELILTLGLAATLTNTIASSFSIVSRVWYTAWELIVYIFFRLFFGKKYELESKN